MIDYIESYLSTLTFEVTSELAVIYASKMDDTYKGLFFNCTSPFVYIRHLRSFACIACAMGRRKKIEFKKV